ncbi:retropepsin-like aspartic protease [Nocardioides mesophilus]|uniref:Clan AA aspartic protease n=1 Tax=Nocardioides mesophilus TaxID=433659 RepID=A0A7G9R761_9ACTN|nr:retropepsin-like aspartic protease [Nocardioides mesophilus]QNN51436.1 clan AA aspartic protease [Nocardioides mesophilus]
MPADSSAIAFERIGHLVRIPVDVPHGSPARFLVDTGIGITVVSSAFAARHRLEPTGRHVVGTRMAGDEVRSPLLHLPRIELGGERLSDLVVAVADLGPTTGPDGFDGILGLDLLGEMPLTIDPFRGVVRLRGRPPRAGRIEVPVVVDRDGESVCLSVELRLPDGTVVTAEVDTGSGSTILDARHTTACGVTPEGPGVRLVREANETGLQVERAFIPVPGPISLAGASQTAQHGSTVMFQDLRLDGLVGTVFLDRYVQTFDTRDGTLTLTPPTSWP